MTRNAKRMFVCVLRFCVCVFACARPGDQKVQGEDSDVPQGPAADSVDGGFEEIQVVVDPWGLGPYTPAHTTVDVDLLEGTRQVRVEIWYPGQGAETVGASTEDFEPSEEERAVLADLLEAAPTGCPSLMTAGLRDGAPRPGLGPRPLVLFSHCLNCGRYSSFSLAEHLASYGMIVVSADHAGPIPFAESSPGESFSAEQLETRVADVRALMDVAIDGTLFAQSEHLEGLVVDPDAVGVFGHSFGSVTAGRVAQDDDRVRAVVGLAAPMDTIFTPSLKMEHISVPILFVLAQEDNSILEIGNDFIRANFEEANVPAWLVTLEDAGHWSVSDLCGLVEAFQPGCGTGARHSEGGEGQSFEYIPVSRGIELTQRVLSTFFLAQLSHQEAAKELLNALPEEQGMAVELRLE